MTGGAERSVHAYISTYGQTGPFSLTLSFRRTRVRNSICDDAKNYRTDPIWDHRVSQGVGFCKRVLRMSMKDLTQSTTNTRERMPMASCMEIAKELR